LTKLGALFLPAFGLLMAGCGTGATSPPSPKPAPTTSAAVVERTPTPGATPRPTQPKTTLKTAGMIIAKKVSAFDKGTAYMRARNSRAARQQFVLSIKLHQRVADSYANLGSIALDERDAYDAFRDYQLAVRLGPNNPAYLYYAAYAALAAHDFNAAIPYVSRCLHLQPRNTAAYHLRFLAYGSLLNYRGQVRDARALVGLAPTSPVAYEDLGIALFNDRKVRQAIQAFTRAIQLQPKEVSYYINRAIAEQFSRQTDLVLRDLRTAKSLTKDPETRKQIEQAIARVINGAKH
jgi:tetratricopeptide (TPR) repeat protein